MRKIKLLIALLLLMLSAQAQRIYGGFYTQERLTNVRNNCHRYEWATKLREKAVTQAAYWLEQSDSTLWHMIPGQDLPRTIDVTFDRLATNNKFLGCLKCGDQIASFGNYPYNPDFINNPWKLTCPNCKSVFPTNDFGAYYQSGIDERGLFNPTKANKKLLYNPANPTNNYGVDDGFGYINENGRAYRFIGYYVWKYWTHINSGLTALADAYLYTGNVQYAHKAAILLDRIADIYPSMDWKPYADKGWYHSDGNSNKGKIGGSIWETNIVTGYADAYDKIISGTLNDTALFQFLQQQSQRYTLPTAKGARAQWVQNIDDNILRTTFRAVLSEQIRGNQGMHQLSVAKAALALNMQPETTQWLDWLFASDGGSIPGLMIGRFDRDGLSDEGAPGYAFMWGNLMIGFAELLNGYAGYTKHDLFKEYPQLRATFTAAHRLCALGTAMPNLGDAGATGLVAKPVNPVVMARGYTYYHDTAIALAAYGANGNTAKGLGLQIFEKDPEAQQKEIQKIAEQAKPEKIKSSLISGFGLAMLQTKTTSLVCNYGRTIMHAHPDLLNFDLFAFNNWLAPDHGYPEFATKWPSNQQWTGSTISHNLVMVNKKPQKEVWGGHTILFKETPGFSVVSIDGLPAYPGLKEYTRTLMLVGENDPYVLDIFQVKGGNDHVYSFHGVPGAVTTQGLQLTKQHTGTYAGDTVSKGAMTGPVGYSHLYEVQRDHQPPSQFTIDWQAGSGYRNVKPEDSIHIRLHALTACNDIALANGDPPQNKPGNPKTLNYVLMHRSGDSLQSTFVNVIEPYRKTPFIKSVKLLHNGVQVTKTDGSIDYLLYGPIETNDIQLKGAIGLIQQHGGAVKAVLVNGSHLRYKKLRLTGAAPYTGIIKKMNLELQGGGWVLVDTPLPTDGSLTGEQLIIKTSSERDATYTIQRVQREGKFTRIDCGPITFIRNYKNPKDYSSGYLYDFEEGDKFTITNHTVKTN